MAMMEGEKAVTGLTAGMFLAAVLAIPTVWACSVVTDPQPHEWHGACSST